MEILKDIEIVDLGLFLKEEKILIIADLHIGYEESLNKQGVLLPRFQFADLIKRLKRILKHTILGPIAQKRNLEIKDYYKTNNIYICHGHKIPEDKDFKKAKTVIIGHEHPAVGIREYPRIERFKCFLLGKYKNKKLIVQPSMNPIAEGTDVLSEKPLSPFLEQNIDNFEVFVIEKEVYKFGKLIKLKSL